MICLTCYASHDVTCDANRLCSRLDLRSISPPHDWRRYVNPGPAYRQFPRIGFHAVPRNVGGCSVPTSHAHLGPIGSSSGRAGQGYRSTWRRVIVIKWWDRAIHCSAGLTGGDDLCGMMSAIPRYSELGWGDFTPLDTTVLLGQPEHAAICSRSWRCDRPFRAWLPTTTISCALFYRTHDADERVWSLE